ncbi:hypothetical protein [Rossellomorea sp. LjRoot5]|uniref:hypothetical protein n=1 Tax=Rossellomorea sp. LjRoot5 TaxID=3342331 RepID=UPI003ECFA691
MFLTLYSAVDFLLLAIGIVLSTQFAYGCTILILEKTMLGYYEVAIFDPPTTLFQKITNAFQKGMLGSGPYIYTKIEKYNWFLRKILFLVALLVQGILSVTLYTVLSMIVDYIFFG